MIVPVAETRTHRDRVQLVAQRRARNDRAGQRSPQLPGRGTRQRRPQIVNGSRFEVRSLALDHGSRAVRRAGAESRGGTTERSFEKWQSWTGVGVVRASAALQTAD